MTESEYRFLQEELSRKIQNNPYRRTGCFKREESYKEGLLAAKSILSAHQERERRCNNGSGKKL